MNGPAPDPSRRASRTSSLSSLPALTPLPDDDVEVERPSARKGSRSTMRQSGTAVSLRSTPATTPGYSTTPAQTPGPGSLITTPANIDSWQVRANRSRTLTNRSLLRGTSSSHVLRSCATVLSDKPCTESYYEKSRPVENIDTFVSHNWRTPRWQKFLVLSFYFNLRVACLSGLVAAAAASGLARAGYLPSFEADSLHGPIRLGILSGPAGLVAFVVTLFGFHELRVAPCLGDTVFLDRLCVHQVDTDLKQAGIKNLAAFLECSRSMLVLYSDVYLQKLWTMYEAATWLILQGGQRMTVLPMNVPQVILGGVFAVTAVQSLFSMTRLNCVRESAVLNGYGSYICKLVVLLASSSIWAWFSGRWAASRDLIEGHVKIFQVASAECHDDGDREEVQHNIVAFMKQYDFVLHNATQTEVFHAFEELVRSDVPKLLKKSFGRVGVPYRWLVCAYLPRIFGICDAYVCLLKAEHIHILQYMILYELGLVFAILPLLAALTLKLTQNPRFRTPVASVCIGAIMTVLLLVLTETMLGLSVSSMGEDPGYYNTHIVEFVSHLASSSNHAPALFLFSEAAWFTITYLTFRPACFSPWDCSNRCEMV